MRFFFLVCTLLCSFQISFAQAGEEQELPRSNLEPLMERYLLDELKSVRQDIERFRTEMTEKITEAELDAADRAISYNANTVTFFFFVITGLGAVFAVIGWKSLHDLRTQMKYVAESQVNELTKAYESRLTEVESDLKEKSDAILSNQEEIEKTQKIHSLWVQASSETEPRQQMEIYDQILVLAPEDADALAAKADAALKLGENDWALSICNRILEADPEHAYALYQRACANAQLGENDAALSDLSAAIDISDHLKEAASTDESFLPLAKNAKFKELISSSQS